MIGKLSDDQRLLVQQQGTPLPLIDYEADAAYVVLAVHTSYSPLGGLQAKAAGFSAIGEGDSQEEALLALVVAMQMQIDTGTGQ